jgi:hypothetical protein
MEKPHGSHHEAQSEQGERKEDFREVVVSKQAEQWADSHDGPGRAKLEEAVDALAERLARDPDLHPRLSKYRLFVHSGDAVFVAKSGDALEISASDLMKKGSAATAGFLIKELRKQEQLPEAASVDESADEELPQGTFRSPEAEPQPEAVEKEGGEPVGDEESLPERPAEGGVEPEDVDAVPAKESAAKSEKEQEEVVQQPEREDLEEDVFPERPAEGGVEPEGGIEEERKPESVADGELPPGTFDDRVAEELEGEYLPPERPALGDVEPENVVRAAIEGERAEPRKRDFDQSAFRFRYLENLYGENESQWRKRVADTASRIAENFYVKNALDWAGIAYHSALLDWHTGHAANLKGAWAAREREVRDLQEGLKHFDEQKEMFQKQGASAETLMRIEKERAEQERKIAKSRDKANGEQSKLEYRNNQRGRYENQRNAVCESFMARIQEKLNPFDEKLSELKKTRDQLRSEIQNDRALLGGYEESIKDFQKKIEQEKYSSLRRGYREAIGEARRCAKDIQKEIAVRQKEIGKIDRGVIYQDKRANPWRDKLAKLSELTKQQGPDTSVPARTRIEKPSFDLGDIDGHPRHFDEGAETIPGAPVDTMSAPERLEFRKEYSLKEFVEGWNSINGSRMKIHEDIIKENFPSFFEEHKDRISFDDGWRFAELYAERYGDEERYEGMSSMQKSVRKRRGLWAQLFGRGNRAKSQNRLMEFLKKFTP